VNDLDIDLARNTPWVDMSACVKFRLDRPSRLAGYVRNIDHDKQTNTQTYRLLLYRLFSPLSAFAFPRVAPRNDHWSCVCVAHTHPKIHDLEWLNGHFTLNFHYYELALRVLLAGFESIVLILIYCRVCLHTRDQRRCGQLSSGRWSTEYLESAGKLALKIWKKNSRTFKVFQGPARALNLNK